MAVAQGAHVAELEIDNARLWTELKGARQALVEPNATQSLLSVSWEELEPECAGLHAAVDGLTQEKAQIMTYREADVAAEQKKFWDYCLGSRRKLHDLLVILEGAVNEIGA
jgi:hypothetical protein